MSFDDPAATHDELGGIVTERSQRQGGLLHQHALIATAGAGDVAKPFDRVHHGNASERVVALAWPVVAGTVALDIPLTTIGGESRPLEEWVTTFHLASVVLDPYTNESSWVLRTAARILDGFRGADVRVNLVLTCSADEARDYLGPLASEFMVFCDPERQYVRGLGLATLPAFVFVRHDGTVQAAAEGWEPHEWRRVAKVIADNTSWIAPVVPLAGDPSPFRGTPALG